MYRASDKCQREKRKTVNGDDILWAMSSLGFEDAVVVLQTYLKKIREVKTFVVCLLQVSVWAGPALAMGLYPVSCGGWQASAFHHGCQTCRQDAQA